MSKQFRDRLRQPGGNTEEALYSRELQRAFSSSVTANVSAPAWSGHVKRPEPAPIFEQIPQHGGSTSSASIESATRPDVTEFGQNAASRAEAESRRTWPSSEMPAPGVGPELSAPALAITATNALAEEPASLLAGELREYWRLERRAAESHTAGSAPVEPRGDEKRHIRELFPATQPSPVQALRPGQATFARRLQSFVSGRGEPREHTARAAWHPADESEPASPRYRRGVPVAPGAPLADEFASRLSETLSTQAIHHGIDLT
jgi:hypothetical protein